MRRFVSGLGIVVLVAIALVPATGAAERASTREEWPLGATPLDDSPFAGRRNVAVAVRGANAYFVGGVERGGDGGERVKRDAAVLDLRTKRWRDLPELPLPRTLTTGAIWAGKRLIVTGVTCPGDVGDEHGCTGGKQVAATYSVRDEAWRKLKVPRRFRHGLSGGLRPLLADRRVATFVIGESFTVSFDLKTQRWREVPPQVGGSVDAICSTRGYAAFLGGARPGTPNGLRLLEVGGRSWSGPQPGYDGADRGQPPPICSGNDVVIVWATASQATCADPCAQPPQARYEVERVQRFDRATGQWSDAPLPPSGGGVLAVGTGPRRVVDFLGIDGGPGLRLDLVTGTWTPIAAGPDLEQMPRPILWTRGLAVVQDSERLYVYRPG